MLAATALRTDLAGGSIITAPGAYDCITAMLIERAGFKAVYMSGGCTAAMLGYPDYGLATMTELVDNAGRIAGAVRIPVIADADTGFGNELNAIRAVREYEQRGVAAIQIEDQEFPKKCGHLDSKKIIPLDEYLSKIRAAAGARRHQDTIIIARTDARAFSGFDDAVQRMNAALAAGADVAFLEAPQTIEETADAPKRINGPCLLNVVRGGKSPLTDLRQAMEMGYRIAIVPALLLMHAMGACEEVLEELQQSQIHPPTRRNLTVRQMFQRVGSDEWDRLQNRVAPKR